MPKELTKRILSSIILLPLVFFFLKSGPFFTISLTVFCFIIACYEWNKMNRNNYYKIAGLIFLLFSFYSFYNLTIEIFLITFVILICVSTDIGGYVFGKIFKGPKLTTISPNKTLAGVIGGYFLSLICLLIITNYIDFPDITFQLFILTILLSTVSQVGDIIISYFKRQAKVKNTGSLIPGHGGLLDRIDGMIFAVPTLYVINLLGFLNL